MAVSAFTIARRRLRTPSSRAGIVSGMSNLQPGAPLLTRFAVADKRHDGRRCLCRGSRRGRSAVDSPLTGGLKRAIRTLLGGAIAVGSAAGAIAEARSQRRN